MSGTPPSASGTPQAGTPASAAPSTASTPQSFVNPAKKRQTKKQQKMQAKTNKDFNTVKFIVVQPNLEDGEYPVPGCLVVMTGYVEKHACNAMYEKNQEGADPKHANFVEAIGVCHWMFKQVDPNDPHGTQTLKYKGFNGKFYDCKGLVLVPEYPEEDPNTHVRPHPQQFTQDHCYHWFETVFKPAYMTHLFDATRQDEPKLADEWYFVNHHWSSILTHGDICKKLMYTSWILEDAFENFKEFLKANKGHVYSIWARGMVPLPKLISIGFTEENLDPRDYNRLQGLSARRALLQSPSSTGITSPVPSIDTSLVQMASQAMPPPAQLPFQVPSLPENISQGQFMQFLHAFNGYLGQQKENGGKTPHVTVRTIRSNPPNHIFKILNDGVSLGEIMTGLPPTSTSPGTIAPMTPALPTADAAVPTTVTLQTAATLNRSESSVTDTSKEKTTAATLKTGSKPAQELSEDPIDDSDDETKTNKPQG